MKAFVPPSPQLSRDGYVEAAVSLFGAVCIFAEGSDGCHEGSVRRCGNTGRSFKSPRANPPKLDVAPSQPCRRPQTEAIQKHPGRSSHRWLCWEGDRTGRYARPGRRGRKIQGFSPIKLAIQHLISSMGVGKNSNSRSHSRHSRQRARDPVFSYLWQKYHVWACVLSRKIKAAPEAPPFVLVDPCESVTC